MKQLGTSGEKSIRIRNVRGKLVHVPKTCSDAQGCERRPVDGAAVRETLIASVAPGMALWRERLFVSMSKNATKASEYFNVPTNRVVELGTQVEL